MRKRIIDPGTRDSLVPEEGWLNLADLADVEVSSEDPAHPIESALLPGTGPGWRAEQTGEQRIRLLFHEPQMIRRIDLVFEEDQEERTQQFVLKGSADSNQPSREIVRQQYNFNPHDTTREHECYDVDLAALTTLELVIDPDMTRGAACASLKQLRLA